MYTALLSLTSAITLCMNRKRKKKRKRYRKLKNVIENTSKSMEIK